MEILAKAKPDAAFMGEKQFDGYCAFIFIGEEVAFLESPIVGNALYIMSSADWKELSKLSKTELLTQHAFEVDRIIHLDIGWSRKLVRWYPAIFKSR